MKSHIYLDHAATTPMVAAARTAMVAALDLVGNPSSVHAAGRAANGLLERSRAVVADWAGVAPACVVFTSGGTEALALALHGAGALRVVASATEHVAVLGGRPDAVIAPVDGEGRVDPAALARLVGAGDLVAVQAANNETGVVQDVAAAADLVARAGAMLLVDCVQSAAYAGVAPADFAVVSAHKLGGPAGVGCLIVRDPARLAAVQRGGGQERGLRGGTPNLAGIAGFAAAIAAGGFGGGRIGGLRERLEARVVAGWPEAVVNGGGVARLPHIVSLGLPGVSAQTQVMHLDLAGFMVSAGAACSSGKVAQSHVLAAMGLGALASQSIRVSLGPATTVAEVDAFAEAWLAMTRRLAPARCAA